MWEISAIGGVWGAAGGYLRSVGERPEELERGNNKEIVSVVVQTGLAETDEAEGLTQGSTDLEVAGHTTAVHIVVVLARVNGLPRALAPVV